MVLLPPAATLQDGSSILEAASILFEPSPPLEQHLAPTLAHTAPYSSYNSLITACDAITVGWDDQLKAAFVAAHPRIGEVSGLSALSAQEQASKQTPPEVLAKLEVRLAQCSTLHEQTRDTGLIIRETLSQELNQLYEQRFPGLRYITFVAGRSRAEVAKDLEAFLKDHDGDVYPPESSHWKAELERALADIWAIARHRVKNMGLQ